MLPAATRCNKGFHKWVREQSIKVMRAPRAAEPVAQPGGEFKPACAATDDDEAMFPRRLLPALRPGSYEGALAVELEE